MTVRLANPLVRDLLEVADSLAATKGRPNLQNAAFRRAVSTAYYAIFHAVCYICADQLVRWNNTGQLEPIYRSLDHRAAKTKLTSSEAKTIDPAIGRIGDLFRTLQRERNLADYKPPTALYKRKEVLGLTGEARDAITLIENLGQKARLEMAVLLIARPRSE